MATSKKSTTRKSTTVKKSTPKKSTTTARKTTTKKRAPKSQAQQVRSFHVSKPTRPFMSFNYTRESSYWIVLGVVVIAFGWWIMKLQADIEAIYDSIDANSQMVISQPTPRSSD